MARHLDVAVSPDQDDIQDGDIDDDQDDNQDDQDEKKCNGKKRWLPERSCEVNRINHSGHNGKGGG